MMRGYLCKKRGPWCLLFFVLVLFMSSCEMSDNGDEIFLSIPVYTESEDTISRDYSEVCNLLLEETDLIDEVLYDTSYTVTKGYNVTMILYQQKYGWPVCVFIAEVDLKSSGLTIGTSLPDNGTKFKRQKLTKQAKHAEEKGITVWGGINADFFNISNGVPKGIVHKAGRAIKTTFDISGATWFAITNENKAMVGRESEYYACKPLIQDAASGLGVLVKNGKAVVHKGKEMYPRTSIGVSQDSTTIYMVAADGKRKNYSIGLSMNDLGVIQKVLGAHNAINLDGGGSTTFIVRNTEDEYGAPFKVINHPSDKEGERPVANGLLVMQK